MGITFFFLVHELSSLRSSLSSLRSYVTIAPCQTNTIQTGAAMVECFERMAEADRFRNVAARVLAGNEAYGNVTVCEDSSSDSKSDSRSDISSDSEDTEGKQECGQTLRERALAGVCALNHIALR